MNYRRATVAGASYFFTVNLANRNSSLMIEQINLLRETMREIKQTPPFEIEAMVVLPEHIHAVWRLPEGDNDYPTRWMLIKTGFSRRLPKEERIRASRARKRERCIWQRRYWEPVIRDEMDWQRHVDDIHFNPVKHGWVTQVADWPYSSFHKFVRMGWLSPDWGSSENMPELDGGERAVKR